MARRADAGFTLIETVVALGVLGLVMAGLASGLRFGTRAWQAQAARSLAAGDLDAVHTTLRHLLEEGRRFRGTSGSLAFVGTMPEALGLDGPFEMRLYREGGDILLSYRRPPRRGAAPPPSPYPPVVLASGTAGLELAFHGAVGGWRAATEGQAAPSLIRVRLLFGDGDARRWPDLIARPAATPVIGPRPPA